MISLCLSSLCHIAAHHREAPFSYKIRTGFYSTVQTVAVIGLNQRQYFFFLEIMSERVWFLIYQWGLVLHERLFLALMLLGGNVSTSSQRKNKKYVPPFCCHNSR